MERFWRWYEQNLAPATVLAAILFTLQLVHLYWLTTDVVLMRLVGRSFFDADGIWQLLIVLVDYTEIPAIVTTSFVYLNDIRKGEVRRGLTYLVLLNSQWLHLYWITDEFVLEQLVGAPGGTLPTALAWLAIAIDYLELPVIVDTIRRLPELLRARRTA